MTVSFHIAGVQKAGTTALYSFLAGHPQLFLPRQKEVHFFDSEKVNWAAPQYGVYERFFAGRTDGQLAGEATPIYTYWAPATARIALYNPDIKLIVCLRDPVVRAYSHWEMEVSRGYDRLSFQQAIREGRQRIPVHPDTVEGCHRVFSYVERGFYAPQIARLLRYFPAENILFLHSARLRHAHEETLAAVCDFLGVERFVRPPEPAMIRPTKKRNDLGPMREEDQQYLTDLYRDDSARTQMITGLDLSDWLSVR